MEESLAALRVAGLRIAGFIDRNPGFSGILTDTSCGGKLKMATVPNPQQQPSPIEFFDAVNGFQRTSALRAAVELGIFTEIAHGATDVGAIARKCNASERGVRILSDYLVCIGFLEKNGTTYGLTETSALFLDRESQAYLGDMVNFLLNPRSLEAFGRLTESVRRGSSALDHEALDPDNPVWTTFARNMMNMMVPIARATAAHLHLPVERPVKVLDIAASHGMYGISVAQKYPKAKLVAVDWPSVLQVTRENVERFGIAERFSTIPGDAFKVDFGTGYDAILLPNILHHFDFANCVELLKKSHAALAEGGVVAIIEFVPNEDRVSPPAPAMFALTMLAGTPSGDAYTLREFSEMLRWAGFQHPTAHPLPPSPHTLVLAKK